MRLPPAIACVALIGLHGTVNAGPLRACAQLGALVHGALTPLLAKLGEPNPDATQLDAQFRTCLSSRNICSVMYNARYGKQELVTGNVTADLPARYLSEKGDSSLMFLVRSIPRVRNDSNQYCLVSEKHSGPTVVRQWDVYGWVIPPNAGNPLPLKRQLLDRKGASDPGSLRALAAALWAFAQHMSGQPSPQDNTQ